MCGICGKWIQGGERVDEGLIRRMNAILAHRGPDDEGLFLHHGADVSLGLGHRRLAIIDLSGAGHQPMTNEEGTIHIVFNGEIYNFQELRQDLVDRGHHFRSATDTEVLIHLYEQEGVDCVKKLVGMFAFAVWDSRSQTLFLARDHIGVKPLVYCWDGRSFVFASELKALLLDPDIPRDLDEEALDLYLSLNYIPAPYTIYRGIRKLSPGCSLTLDNPGHLNERPYWNLDTQGGPHRQTRDLQEMKEDLFAILNDAVARQMIADVPLGAFLSGGIDSSIVVALMARHADRPVKTYSIGFADMPLYDETAYARDVARMYATDHHEIKLRSGDMLAVIPQVLEGLDEPFADSSVIPTFVVSRETRKDVTVALSGDGGDELFAGYRMYKGEGWYRKYSRIPAFLRKGIIEPVIHHLPDSRDSLLPEYVRRAKKFLRGTGDSLEERFCALNAVFDDKTRQAIQIRGKEGPSPAQALFSRRLQEMNDDVLNRMLYTDLKESLPGDMLRKVDAASMAHSLEVRVPLLDHRVCMAAFSMAGTWKLRDGHAKYIFIETFRDLLPPSVLTKPKWGFEIPISRWLKTDLRYLLEDYLSPDRIRRQGIFQAAPVEILKKRLLENRGDTSWQIWNLIAFQVWHERYG